MTECEITSLSKINTVWTVTKEVRRASVGLTPFRTAGRTSCPSPQRPVMLVEELTASEPNDRASIWVHLHQACAEAHDLWLHRIAPAEELVRIKGKL